MTNDDLSNFLTYLMTFHDPVMTLMTLGDNILMTAMTGGEDIMTTQMTLVKVM